MTGISKLYCGSVEASDVLRYSRHSAKLPSHLLQFSKDKKPVVVWNCTKACNLKCRHCYSDSGMSCGEKGELSTSQAMTMIEDLSSFGCPVLLFSGGEPCLRKDMVELAGFARQKGMRVVLSTNGTLLTKDLVAKLAKVGLSYIGVSIDGNQSTHDSFRGVNGAWDKALEGIRTAKDAGIKTGLRFTINRGNFQEIPSVFELMKREGVNRACFYHLVSAGRGAGIGDECLTHEETRSAVRTIMNETKRMFDAGGNPEILTVDNHADGPFVYLEMVKEKNLRADQVLELLKMNGGNSSGHGIGCIGWDGEVYADQFSRHRSYGNIKDTPFSKIWQSKDLEPMREKSKHVKGRCRTCRWLPVCGGNLRARAEIGTGDMWGEDKACYLTDEEIK
jgi:radical SAM protein with 4Fe4S-binding SPASM domain